MPKPQVHSLVMRDGGQKDDASKAVSATHTYAPFGNLMSQAGTLSQPFKFSTKVYDSETGLSYFGYRFYAPALGRWMTRDPIGYAGGLNLYGFVGNNAVNRVDPWGYSWESVFEVLGEGSVAKAEADQAAGVAYFETAGLIGNWVTGTGPNPRIFSPDSWQVKDLMNAPGVNAARQYHRAKNDMRCGESRVNTTDFKGAFGYPLGPIRAGVNPNRQFIGSYTVNIYAGSDYDLFIVWNRTSMTSASYKTLPSYERHRFFPFGGNMDQIYWWKEPIE